MSRIGTIVDAELMKEGEFGVVEDMGVVCVSGIGSFCAGAKVKICSQAEAFTWAFEFHKSHYGKEK